MTSPPLSLANDQIRFILSCHRTQADALLHDVDAIAYGIRLAEGIPLHAHPEGLFARLTEGFTTSITPKDFLDFLNLLPRGALPNSGILPDVIHRTLWQYGHLLERANSRFELALMDPMATDVLARNTESVLLDLLLWFKAASFRARHHTHHLLAATCKATRDLLLGLEGDVRISFHKVRATSCHPCAGLNEFHHTNSLSPLIDANYLEWLDPNAVLATYSHPGWAEHFVQGWRMLSHDITSYPRVMALVDELVAWDPSNANTKSKTPTWLLSKVRGNIDLSDYTDADLFGKALDVEISWQWSKAPQIHRSMNPRSGAGMNDVYKSSLLPMRLRCEDEIIPGHDYFSGIVPERDYWLWPVSYAELTAWHHDTVSGLAEQRACVQLCFHEIAWRAEQLGLPSSHLGEPYHEELEATMVAITHDQLCAHQVLNQLNFVGEHQENADQHLPTIPQCTCRRCPVEDPHLWDNVLPYW